MMRLVVTLPLFLLLQACVTSSPEVLFSTEPLGEAQKQGAYPKIGVVPQGETAQITPTEREATKAQLQAASKPGEAQAQQDNQTAYNAEVAAMKKLAEDERKRRLREIESRIF